MCVCSGKDEGGAYFVIGGKVGMESGEIGLSSRDQGTDKGARWRLFCNQGADKGARWRLFLRQKGSTSAFWAPAWFPRLDPV